MRRVVGAAILLLGFGAADLLYFLRPVPVPPVSDPVPSRPVSPVVPPLAAHAPVARVTAQPAASGTPPAFVQAPLAFLSHAPADSLQLLPGIGPVLASRIVAARSTGTFRTWEDVDRVRGIGPATLRRLRTLSDG